MDYKLAYNLADNEVPLVFHMPPSGWKLMRSKDPFVFFGGPAGTGKTRISCEVLHKHCLEYPGIRVLMARQFRSTMTHTCMYTLGKEVLDPKEKVRFSPGQQSYIYPPRTGKTGPLKGKEGVCSEIVVAGLDDIKKVMSSQFDIIYINEGTDIRRDQLEYLFTRNRNGVLPWQSIWMDFNPQHPKHWVKQIIDIGKLGSTPILYIEGKHTDNPRWWDREKKDWTEEGYDFIFVKLDAMTGARRRRLKDGEWAAAEGQIYDTFDRSVHVVSRFKPPNSWRRIWSFDFGYVNPFVWQNWVIDPDGFMYLYQEIYKTNTLVEDHCREIWESVKGQPYPDALICDHDAEGRATLERYFGMVTLPAYKDVAEGIENVKKRMRLVHDGVNKNMEGQDIGRPRMAYMEGALVHDPDRKLVEASKPLCTIEEIPSYAWDPKSAVEKQRGDVPVKVDDHGCDTMRYAAAFEDSLANDPSEEEPVIPFGLYHHVQISPY